MRLVTCNVNGRVRAARDRQLEALLGLDPDVLCLQEVTRGSFDGWRDGLTEAGFSVESTIDLLDAPYPPPPYPSPPFPPWDEPHDQIQRKNFNLTASRHPITALPGLTFTSPEETSFAFPEKYLAVKVRVDRDDVDVHNAHLPPGSSRGLIKLQAFIAIARRVESESPIPRILCGDFNDPPSETDDGPVVDPSPNSLFEGAHKIVAQFFANPDMRDVYRDVHQRGEPFPVSHRTGRGRGTNPKRYDHIMASPVFTTERCQYLSEWLDETPDHGRLSDHAPMVADLSMA